MLLGYDFRPLKIEITDLAIGSALRFADFTFDSLYQLQGEMCK